MMCQFFSFVTEPENHGGQRFYIDWNYRREHLNDENDSHSTICKHFGIDEDKCNKYEFNPLTRAFMVDQLNSPVDDRIQAEGWVNQLDFRRVVEPLIIKPIINPFDLPPAETTDDDVNFLKEWDSVRDSVWAYISSFFNIEYKTNVTPAIKLWERGIVASFDGNTWRLHTGKDAHVIYEMRGEE